MDTEESRPELVLGRSSSKDSRVDNLSRSNSLQRADVRGKGNKGHRSGNDLFVCFAPRTSLNLVSRPVLSPGRDKGSRRSRGPVYALSRFERGAKKQGYEEAPEPTSPKVTCIGQVRVKQKQGKALASAIQEIDGLRDEESSRLKTKEESTSSRRFFSNSSKQQKWGPILGSRKKTSRLACSNLRTDFSCFGLPCDSHGSMPSSSREGKSCRAIFARSLLLIQETEEKRQSKAEEADRRKNEETSKVSCKDAKTLEATLQILGTDKSGFVSEPTLEVVDNTPFKVEEEDNAQEVENFLKTEEEDILAVELPPPPPNALLLTRRKLEPFKIVVPQPSVSSVLKRSTSAPSQSRTRIRVEQEAGKMLDNDCEVGQLMNSGDRELRLSSSKAVLKRCKSDCTGVARDFVETRCLSENSSSVVQPLVTRARHERLESVPEEEKKQDEQNVACLIPQEEPEGSQEKPSEDQALEREVDPAPPPPSPTAPLMRCSAEALKVSVDIVPETWIWQECSNGQPLDESRDEVCRENVSDAFDAESNDQGSQESNAEAEASSRRDPPDFDQQGPGDDKAVLEQEEADCVDEKTGFVQAEEKKEEGVEEPSSKLEETGCKDLQGLTERHNNFIPQEKELDLPEWEEGISVEAAGPDAVLLLTYKVEALRLSVDAALETLSNGERFLGEVSHERVKVEERSSPLEDIGELEYTRVMEGAGGRKGYSHSIFQWKSRETKALKVPHAFRLQRCKSEPVRLAF